MQKTTSNKARNLLHLIALAKAKPEHEQYYLDAARMLAAELIAGSYWRKQKGNA